MCKFEEHQSHLIQEPWGWKFGASMRMTFYDGDELADWQRCCPPSTPYLWPAGSPAEGSRKHHYHGTKPSLQSSWWSRWWWWWKDHWLQQSWRSLYFYDDDDDDEVIISSDLLRPWQRGSFHSETKTWIWTLYEWRPSVSNCTCVCNCMLCVCLCLLLLRGDFP